MYSINILLQLLGDFVPRHHGTIISMSRQVLATLQFRSLDDYNFPLTASLKSQFLRFLGGKGGHISNLIFLTPKRHFLCGNDA